MSTATNQNPTISSQDLARLFDVSIGTIKKWRGEGKLPNGQRIGRYVFLDVREVAAAVRVHKLRVATEAYDYFEKVLR